MAYSIAVTGHRPEKITNWPFVAHQLGLAFMDNQAHHVIQGMAAGVDLLAANVAFTNRIPYTCARPWAGHEPRKADKRHYEKALDHAQRIVDVNPSLVYPGAWVYQVRNEWMVDRCDMVVAVWDGSGGGTANCVKYAEAKDIPIWRINPATYEMSWYNE